MRRNIEDREFDGIIKTSFVPILIEFWQPDCGHCLSLMKELELLQEEVGSRLLLFKMNVQENFLIPGELEIQSLPALALYVHGTFKQFIGGIGKKEHILAQLNSWLPSVE
ncbi:MAG: thioredoxin domain-containing protein [Nitrospirae bacterium]|nr:thioredoxin domain-containing protein [Nitrospirota bacterium]